MELKFIIKNENENEKINQILQNQLGISSRLLYKLIKGNNIKLNNDSCDTRNTANVGDLLTVDFNYAEDNSNIVPTKMNLDIVFEDEWLLVVNKPAGIAVHPSILHYSDSLCNGVRFYFDSINLHKKIRPVNRLDLNTSGLVVFAKCEYIQECLISEMKHHIFKKEYLCVCEEQKKKNCGTINAPIARKENSIIERCVSETGQESITHYEVLRPFDDFSLVKCLLETGRTHQIRVHMAFVGHPLVGDSLYGSISDFIDRQALHCFYLQFVHPVTKNVLSLRGELPLDFKNLIFEI